MITLNVLGTVIILLVAIAMTRKEYGTVVEDDSFRRFLLAIVEWIKPYAAYIWYVTFALWGAFANYLSTISRNKADFSWKELAIAAPIGGFSGLCVVYLLQYAGLSNAGVAFGGGMAGFMGGRMLTLIEAYIVSKSEASKS